MDMGTVMDTVTDTVMDTDMVDMGIILKRKKLKNNLKNNKA